MIPVLVYFLIFGALGVWPAICFLIKSCIQPQENKPVSQEDKPISQEDKPISQEGKPVSQEDKPISPVGPLIFLSLYTLAAVLVYINTA